MAPTMIFRPPAMDTADTWFNAQLLKTIRRELGWTQLELAKRADLSVRVIAKAESGRGVSNRTMNTLVRVLREAGKDITYDDFTGDPRSIVQKFLQNCQTYKKNALSQCRGLVAPDIVIHMDGNPLVNPLAGTYQGIEEFEALLYKYYDIFVCDGGTLGDFTQMRLIGQEVIAWGHQYVRVPEAPPSLPSFTMLRIVFREGAIARIDSYYEAAGLMSRVEAWARMYPEAAWLKYFDIDALRTGPRRRAGIHLGGGFHARQPAVENEPPTA